MLKNVYLFVWEDQYSLDMEINRWKSNFVEKFGEDSMFFYNTETWDNTKVSQSIFGWGLFSQKKLNIISWLPISWSWSNVFKIAQVEQFVDKFLSKKWIIPDDSLLVFVSNKPDKRSKLYKFLKDNANLKEFNKMKDFQLKSFIKSELNWLKINDDAIDLILNTVWNDMYRVFWELNKLKFYCEYNSIETINVELVHEIIYGNIEAETFEFLRLLFKNKNKALKHIDMMKYQWINWNAFLWGLYWWLKLYIVLFDLYNRGMKDSSLIVKQSWLNPFVVKQNMKNINLIVKNWNTIKNMYKSLINTEHQIKTGLKNEDFFWLETKNMVNKFKI